MYDIKTLEEFYNNLDVCELISRYKRYITENDDVNLPIDVKTSLSDFIKSAQKKPKTKNLITSFMDLIDISAHDAAWNSQNFFDIMAVNFLLHVKSENSHVYEYFKKYLILDNETTYELLGLLAASGNYSRLAITHVPALLDWRISLYDGKEHILLI